MDVIKKIKEYKWEKWLERPFSPFITSLFVDGKKEEYFLKIGVPNVECEVSLYQRGMWYKWEGLFKKMAESLKIYLEDQSIFDIVKSLETTYLQSKKRLKDLIIENGSPIEQLKEVKEILTKITTFIWLAHGLEEFYNQKLKVEVPKYIKGDIDKFIGDASFPKKKNAHALMEEAILKGEDFKKMAKGFGWLKIRDGFSEPFSSEEIKKIKKDLEPVKEPPKVNIPKELKQLFEEVKELVYFRTARTDIFYELIFMARPIFKRVAEFYKIPFIDLRHYTIQSLILGKPTKYAPGYSMVAYKGEAVYTKERIIEEKKQEKKRLCER